MLGVTPAQTAVFGDYLNDLLMLEAGDWSFAMGNAHPDLRPPRATSHRRTSSTVCSRLWTGWLPDDFVAWGAVM